MRGASDFNLKIQLSLLKLDFGVGRSLALVLILKLGLFLKNLHGLVTSYLSDMLRPCTPSLGQRVNLGCLFLMAFLSAPISYRTSGIIVDSNDRLLF